MVVFLHTQVIRLAQLTVLGIAMLNAHRILSLLTAKYACLTNMKDMC